MSMLVLFSTVSFTVEKHYCGDTLIDISVFSEVEKCASESYEIALEKTTKKPCCKDVIDIIKGQDKLQKNNSDISIEHHDITAITPIISDHICESTPKQTLPHKTYIPPNIVYDLVVLNEVFLI